jgi:hypothetical protein
VANHVVVRAVACLNRSIEPVAGAGLSSRTLTSVSGNGVELVTSDPERHAASAVALRSMVEEVVLTPEGDKRGIVLRGDLASMLATASPKSDASGVHRCDAERPRLRS